MTEDIATRELTIVFVRDYKTFVERFSKKSKSDYVLNINKIVKEKFQTEIFIPNKVQAFLLNYEISKLIDKVIDEYLTEEEALKIKFIPIEQEEPTFKNTGDWKAIKDKTTATTAVKNSKGWDATTAKSAIEATQKAISSPANQAAAKSFVGTRTEFLAAKPGSSKAQGVVERSPAADNNAFYWQYAGKALISSAPPLPPDLAKYA